MAEHLTDQEVAEMIIHSDNPEKWRREMKFRIRMRAFSALPRKVGTCAAGLRVYLDNKGPMATGYRAHEQGHSICEHEPVDWDANEKTERLMEIIEEMRGN